MISFDHIFVVLKVSLHQASLFLKMLYIADSPFPIQVYSHWSSQSPRPTPKTLLRRLRVPVPL